MALTVVVLTPFEFGASFLMISFGNLVSGGVKAMVSTMCIVSFMRYLQITEIIGSSLKLGVEVYELYEIKVKSCILFE